MNFRQRISLLWRRFTPLEERLLAAVHEVLPPQAQTVFDAQVAAIALVQRMPRWTEIDFYARRKGGKIDWSGAPSFPHTGEFPLAEVCFVVEKKRYKATLTCIGGHIFDFGITPSPKAVAFADWDAPPTARLLGDPMIVEARRAREPIPKVWSDFLAADPKPEAEGWKFHNDATAFRTMIGESEFLILAEREGGDEYVLHRIEPPASELFYLASHDGTPEPIKGVVADIFRNTEERKG